jgi:hypothetical protein
MITNWIYTGQRVAGVTVPQGDVILGWGGVVRADAEYS